MTKTTALYTPLREIHCLRLSPKNSDQLMTSAQPDKPDRHHFIPTSAPESMRIIGKGQRNIKRRGSTPGGGKGDFGEACSLVVIQFFWWIACILFGEDGVEIFPAVFRLLGDLICLLVELTRPQKRYWLASRNRRSLSG